MMGNPLMQFRVVSLAEGMSFLVLLGIAMPLKYLAHSPQAVQIVGAIHGGLFVLYVLACFRVAVSEKWSAGRVAEALVSSLYPFGPFIFDRKLQREASAREVSVDAKVR